MVWGSPGASLGTPTPGTPPALPGRTRQTQVVQSSPSRLNRAPCAYVRPRKLHFAGGGERQRSRGWGQGGKHGFCRTPTPNPHPQQTPGLPPPNPTHPTGWGSQGTNLAGRSSSRPARRWGRNPGGTRGRCRRCYQPAEESAGLSPSTRGATYPFPAMGERCRGIIPPPSASRSIAPEAHSLAGMRGDAPIPIPLWDGTGSPGRRRRCSSHQMGRRRHPRPGTPHRAGSLQGRRVRVGYPGQQGWGRGGETKVSPEQLGQQPPAGVGSGWEQVTGQLTASQSTRPPCKGTRGLSPTSGWCGRERHGQGRGGLPGKRSSGSPDLSSEPRAPGEPPGTSSEGRMGWRYRGLPRHAGMARWPGMPGRERREGVGYQVLRQGGRARGSPWGPGGVPQNQEGAGRGWADAAGTAGWAMGPGWIWGSLGRKEETSLGAGRELGVSRSAPLP